MVSFAAGAVVGVLTGVIHVKLKVRDLLSGIIMMTASVYRQFKDSRTCKPADLYRKQQYLITIWSTAFLQETQHSFQTVVIILIITLVMKYLLDWYMSTKAGFLLRAVGDNDTIVTSMGVDKGLVKIAGLAISNGLVTLSGCIYTQQQRYFDVSMGTGTVVIGLASVIIGTSLFKKVTFFRVTTSVVIGSIIYKACVALAISFGLQSTDLKLVTAVLFLIILVVSMDRKKKVKNNA